MTALRREMRGPPHERGLAALGERIDTALDPDEPAVDVAEEDLPCIRRVRLEVAWAGRFQRQRRRTSQGLLAVGCHDRLARAASRCRVAAASAVLFDNSGAAFGVAPGSPRHRLDQDLDLAGRHDSQQAQTEQTAELAHARVAFATTAAP